MKCPQCNYVRSDVDHGPDGTCPQCGLVYAKFDPEIEKRRAKLRAISEERLYRQSVSESIKVNAQQATMERQRVVSPRALLCPSCGALGRVTMKRSGHGGLELVLWLCFIVPGVVYSLWRLLTPIVICAECGAHPLIKVGSPKGRRQFAELYPERVIRS